MRRGKPPIPPTGIERAYTAALASVNARLVRLTRRFIRASLEAARKAEGRREDARDTLGGTFDPYGRLRDLDLGHLRIRLERAARREGRGLVDRFGRRIDTHNRQDLARVLSLDLDEEPPAIRAVLEAWRRENVGLITSIGERLHEDVRGVVRDATRRGTRVETLSRDLEERYSVSRSRANLIARDQVLKANADLTRVRHEEAGIVSYVWSTSRDERVRDHHKDLEGTVQLWATPPVTNKKGDRNHPGGDYQCRCVAIPVLVDQPVATEGAATLRREGATDVEISRD